MVDNEELIVVLEVELSCAFVTEGRRMTPLYS